MQTYSPAQSKDQCLKNAVDGLTELRNIKTTTAQLQVTTGAVILYNGYISLPYSASKSYDA